MDAALLSVCVRKRAHTSRRIAIRHLSTLLPCVCNGGLNARYHGGGLFLKKIKRTNENLQYKPTYSLLNNIIIIDNDVPCHGYLLRKLRYTTWHNNIKRCDFHNVIRQLCNFYCCLGSLYIGWNLVHFKLYNVNDTKKLIRPEWCRIILRSLK